MKLWRFVLGIVLLLGFNAYLGAEPLTIIDSSGDRQFINTDTPMPSAPVQGTLGSLKAAVTLYSVDGQIVDITHGLYIVPVSNVPDATYLGDIKFGEAIPAGAAKIGAIRLVGNTAADGSGTDYYALIDTSGHLQVDVLTLPAVVQSVLGSLKTASTLYQTDGVPMDITHPIYIAPSTGASFDIGTVTTLPAITGTVTANAGTNLNTSALATQTTLSALNTKFASGTTIGDVNIVETSFDVGTVTTLPTVELKAGTALIGKFGIDQATANANEVVVKSITAGDNNIGNVDVLTTPITTESTPAYTQRSSQNWWTVYRYDASAKVAFNTTITLTKTGVSGTSWIVDGYSVGSWGCGYGDWQLKIAGSTVAAGGFGPNNTGATYPFPIPIKAGDEETVTWEVTPRGEDAYLCLTLYGHK